MCLRYLYQDKKVPLKKLVKLYKEHSVTSIFRHANKPTGQVVDDQRKYNPGRPKKLSARDERKIVNTLLILRRTGKGFNSKRIQADSGIKHASNWAVRRTLNKHGYFYLQSRKKGLLSANDLKLHVKFARKMLKEHDETFWTKDIAFYLDLTSFVHRVNPSDQAKAPKSRVSRHKKEGPKQGCTAKGKKAGHGGKIAHFVVAISYTKGVICCEQYSKMSGTYFASFIHKHFDSLFKRSINPKSKLFIQDDDPSQNSKAARVILEACGAKLIKFHPDINPIETFFNLVEMKLDDDAEKQNITKESFEEFSARVKQTMLSFPADVIDKTIGSLHKRMKDIITAKGERLKY